MFGHEVDGIAPALLERCDVHVRIPTLGTKGSINVATAGGVVLYELLRKYRNRALAPRGLKRRPAPPGVEASPGVGYHPPMSEDDAPKSAYELAMERLRKQDADSGVETTPLTDQQRTAIAEVRNFYEAKVAEREVLHQSTMRRTADPDARAGFEEQYRRDRERLNSDRDAKIERIRRGEA